MKKETGSMNRYKIHIMYIYNLIKNDALHDNHTSLEWDLTSFAYGNCIHSSLCAIVVQLVSR